MKRFLSLLMWFVPLPLLLVGLNLYADPANLARSGSVADEIIRIHESGGSAAVPDNYDDRMLSLRYIESMTKAPDIVVMGSSRSIQISSEMLGADSFKNNSVTGGVLGDFAALWEAYLENGIRPDTVILELDPWLFDVYRYEGRYLYSYGPYYSSFSRRILGEKQNYISGVFNAKIEPFFSLSYLRESIAYIRDGGVAARGVYAVAEPPERSRAVVRTDGSYVYPASYTAIDKAEYYDRIKVASRTILVETQSYSLAPDRKQLFELLLADIIESGSTPVVLLSPYYPELYDKLESDKETYGRLFEIEDYINETCASLGVAVAGSISPRECGFDDADFIDALHLTEDATARLAQRIPLNKR